MSAVVQERDAVSSLELRSLIDPAELQRIQDRFAEKTGLAMVTVDAAGIPVTEPSRFTPLCQLLRRDPEIRKRCFSCDAHGGFQAALTRKPFVYRCHAGLVDFSVPIIVEEQYLGAVLAGQVFLASGHDALGEMHLGSTDLAPVDGATELREQVTTMRLETLEAAADWVAEQVTQSIGGQPGARRGTLFGREPAVDVDERGDRLAPVAGGNVKAAPLVPLRPGMLTPDRPHVDAAAIRANLLEARVGSNLALLSEYLDRLIPHFHQKVAQLELAELEDVLIGVATSEAVEYGRELSQRVVKQRNRRRGALNRYEAQVYCERLLLLLHDLVEPTLLPKERTIESLLNEINKDPTRFLTATKAAEYLMWSEAHFCRQFKKAMGTSFIHYVAVKRLERAKFLLDHTDLPVLRIAVTLKFQPPNYFSRIFKKHEGITPSQYREQSAQGGK